MKQKFVVQGVEGFDGLQLLSEPTVGRRIYGPGEVVELDDQQHDIAGLKSRGIIRDLPESRVKEG